MLTTKVIATQLAALLLFYDCVTSLIIPEELPTILSLIYSNIPPIKKGTDSRIGVGFRLGQHADFQVLLELGPQTETEPIGTLESKKRRNAMLSAAMRGELGPWAKAVAKYQLQRKVEELQRIGILDEKLQKTPQIEEDKKEKKDHKDAGEWLKKWSKGMNENLENETPLTSSGSESVLDPNGKLLYGNMKEAMNQQLRKLYKEQPPVDKA
ncbi:uncharacterized protein LOC105694664 [Orussus abietinus]|uniref:uncharacterized protein LOC105694664 n=1 Tax=Orussus abietinus TaxID=222816 RepID=UPI0006263347|nr:uncharacterized protein LOC105694664 [Orussus abietinus]XP_012270960.1 uncharacterized protein LOC105694664 [Orussus abietinus]XP_012270961.1 uncharacterized protein LOC105694664 [Orussus abietinus]